MSRSLKQLPHETDGGWREIEELIARVDKLSNAVVPLREFFACLVDETLRALDGLGGAAWLKNAGGLVQPVYQTKLWSDGDSNSGQREMHRRLAEAAVNDGQEQYVFPNRDDQPDDTEPDGQSSSASGLALYVVPIRLEQRIVGALELGHRPDEHAASRRGNMRLLAIMCEFASHYLLRAELQRLRDARALWQQSRVFAREVHGSLELRETAYRVVNDGQRVVNCDRLSLLLSRGRHCRLIAISGTDTIDRRANAVRSLEKLANTVARTRDPLEYPVSQRQYAPEIQPHLEEYLDESHTRMLLAMPLTRKTSQPTKGGDPPVLGILVAERFSEEGGKLSRQGAELVAAHASVSLSNSLAARGWLRLFRTGGATGSGLRILRWLVFSVAVVGLVWYSLWQTADFHVHAPGELQPEQCRDVFAPADGEVVQLFVQHDQLIEAGQEVLVLASPQLDMELRRIEGEYQTTQQRLWSTESARLQAQPAGAIDLARLAAQQEELQQRLRNQQAQLELLQAQLEKLTVRSPIDGRIMTWDVHTLLKDRPVQRGQALVRVGNVKGPWIAELAVPDNRIGYILSAQELSQTPREVFFELATERGVVHEGEIESISGRTESNQDGQAIAYVTVRIDPDSIPDLRSGATISARIHCGRRSLAYVWFHDLIDVVREWLTF